MCQVIKVKPEHLEEYKRVSGEAPHDHGFSDDQTHPHFMYLLAPGADADQCRCTRKSGPRSWPHCAKPVSLVSVRGTPHAALLSPTRRLLHPLL